MRRRSSPAKTRSCRPTREVLRHADTLRRLSGEAYGALYDGETAALVSLGQVWKRVERAGRDRPELPAHMPTARDGDQGPARGSRHRPPRLQRAHRRQRRHGCSEVEDRLALIERLKRKYGPRARRRARSARARSGPSTLALTGGSATPDALRQELERRTHEFVELAAALSTARRGRRAPAHRRARAANWPNSRWPHARVELRFAATARGRVVRARHRPRRVLPVAEPRRGSPSAGADRLGRRVVPDHAGAEDAVGARRPPGRTLVFDEVDAGIGGRVATVVGEKLRRLGARRPGAVHHPPAADRRCCRHALPHRQAGEGEPDGDDGPAPGGGRPGRRNCARMMAGGAASAQVREGARELLEGATVAHVAADPGDRRNPPRRRKRKAKVLDRRKRKCASPEAADGSCMAKKYLIETYGCQMNVHDSERMAGLLEAAGYERTDADETPTWSSSTPARCGRRPRRSCTRASAISRAWHRRTGQAPMVAVTGCVAQQEGFQDTGTLQSGGRGARHPAGEAAADARRARGAAQPPPDRRRRTRRTTSRRSRWASRATTIR